MLACILPVQPRGQQRANRTSQGADFFQNLTGKKAFGSPRQTCRIVVAARHGESDASFRACCRHDNFNPCVCPDGDGRVEIILGQTPPRFGRGANRDRYSAWTAIRPRRFPFVDFWKFGEESVNRGRGRSAEDMDFEFLLRTAHKGQTHHSIAEMMQFDDEQTRLHRENHHLFRR